MRKISIIWFTTLLIVGCTFLSVVPKQSDFDFSTFSKLPILHNGRLKPIDSFARNVLLNIQEKQYIRYEGKKSSATEWLLDVATRPDYTDQIPIFRLLNPDKVVPMSLGLDVTKKVYSYNDLKPALHTIQAQATEALPIKEKLRTPFQRDIVTLYNKINLYLGLKNTFFLEGTQNFSDYTTRYINSVALGKAAFHKFQQGRPLSHKESIAIQQFNHYFKAHQFLSNASLASLYPAIDMAQNPDLWTNTGSSLLILMGKQSSPHLLLPSYALLLDGYQKNDPDTFNMALADIDDFYARNASRLMKRNAFEVFFNTLAPFYKSLVLYLLCFLGIFVSFIRWNSFLYPLMYNLLFASFGLHTFGILSRMIVSGRPPVTNLYSSAVFVGWMAILLGLLIEKKFKNKLGIIVSSVIGFFTLIVAHHLSLSGDTLEMMQAVLDTNFWLATHVVIVSMGYSGTFLAGLFGSIYIIRGVFMSNFGESEQKDITRITYGIICFSLLFSFVGTILGGIWADQSWGRFWGWDPKENGALLIVLWNAIILHARLGGYIRERGIMIMAVFGNVVTATSWFGVNLLGVGLHSYGFTENGFLWLMVFFIIHILIMGFGLIPQRLWISHSTKHH